MRKFKVEIKKTVQVKQYEPVTITLATEGETEDDQFIAERNAAYAELKKKMNEIFNTPSCLD